MELYSYIILGDMHQPNQYILIDRLPIQLNISLDVLAYP